MKSVVRSVSRYGVALALFLGGLFVAVTPAEGTGGGCVPVVHSDLTGISSSGTEGKAELTGSALRLTTVGQGDKVGFSVSVTPVKLADVKELSYKTKQISGGPDERTLAGLKLSLSNGKTAVLEPLYDQDPGAQPVDKKGDWQTWDGKGVGRRWWVTGAPDTYLSWDALVAAYPDVNVVAVRVEQGSWNHGTVTLVKDLRYSLGEQGCKTHSWKKAEATQTATPTPGGTKTPTPNATTASPVPGGHVGTTAATPTGSSLPVTGEGGTTPLIFLFGAMLVASGAVALGGVYLWRRRSESTFTA